MTIKENTIFSLVIALIIGMGFVIGWNVKSSMDKDAAMREYVDSLFYQSRETVTFDSIRSAIELKILDSIRAIRSDLEKERIARRRETLKHRRETAKIRHRIDSIGPINRPDF